MSNKHHAESGAAVRCSAVVRPTETITEHLSRIVPHGEKCHGCPKGDPHGIIGYSGDVFCHLMEEVMVDGNKECSINDDRWSNAELSDGAGEKR